MTLPAPDDGILVRRPHWWTSSLPSYSWNDSALQSRLDRSAKRVDELTLKLWSKQTGFERTPIGQILGWWKVFRTCAIDRFRLYGSIKGPSKWLKGRRILFDQWTGHYNGLCAMLEYHTYDSHKLKNLRESLIAPVEVSELLQAFNEVSLCWYEAVRDLHRACENYARIPSNDAKPPPPLSCLTFIYHNFLAHEDSEQGFELKEFPLSLLSDSDKDAASQPNETWTTLRGTLATMWAEDNERISLAKFSSLYHQASDYEQSLAAWGRQTSVASRGHEAQSEEAGVLPGEWGI